MWPWLVVHLLVSGWRPVRTCSCMDQLLALHALSCPHVVFGCTSCQRGEESRERFWAPKNINTSSSPNYEPIDEVHHLVFPKTVKVFKIMFFYIFIWHQIAVFTQTVLKKSVWNIRRRQFIKMFYCEKYHFWINCLEKWLKNVASMVDEVTSFYLKLWKFDNILNSSGVKNICNCMLLYKVQTFSEYVRESCIFFTLVDHDFVIGLKIRLCDFRV